MNITLMTLMSMQYLNAPYKWGGNGPWEFDCSGLVLKVLYDIDIMLPDMTSQQLHDYIIRNGQTFGTFQSSNPSSDCILFFGKSVDKITHVSIAISEDYMIEAGGAGSDSINMSTKELGARDARVRIKEIKNRRDLISCFRINYKLNKGV
jgi:cell wall-associated NlpC family hydrolase